jgi:hypothetical protein
MPLVLGVDVSLGRGLDVALVEDSVVKLIDRIAGAEALGRLLEELRPAAVAIDAPPRPGMELLRDPREAARLTVPPRPGTHLPRRIAEYELSRRGIGSHATPADAGRMFTWMTEGFAVFAKADGAGYAPYFGDGSSHGRALEVFPYASYVALAGCLSPGRRERVAWRRSVLQKQDVRGLEEAGTIDALDAVCAALTGERFLSGGGCWVGDSREGVIVLPVPALEDGYRRCRSAEGLARPPAAPVLCECGCGAAVRRRFLPGHDGRLKARLLREARAGDGARRHLARLGWSHFLKEDESS